MINLPSGPPNINFTSLSIQLRLFSGTQSICTWDINIRPRISGYLFGRGSTCRCAFSTSKFNKCIQGYSLLPGIPIMQLLHEATI